MKQLFTTMSIYLLRVWSVSYSKSQLAAHGWSPSVFATSSRHRYLSEGTSLSFHTDSGISSQPDTDEDIKTPQYARLPRLYVGPVLSEIFLPPAAFFSAVDRQPSPPTPLQAYAQIQLSSDQSHYISNVLRLFKKKASPLVRLFDGTSGEWLARLSSVSVEEAEATKARRRRTSGSEQLNAQCLECLRPQFTDAAKNSIIRSRSPSLWLAPPKKKERLRWLVEKTTELNVQQFTFLDSDHSETGSLSMDKLHAYALEAAEQSERLDVPRFVCPGTEVGSLSSAKEFTVAMDDILQVWSSDAKHRHATKLLFCRERRIDSLSILEVLSRLFKSDSVDLHDQPRIAFVVGPEGGWSPREEAMMDDLVQRFPDDASNVSLGSNVLRAETAAMTAIAAHAIWQDATMKQR
jgi:16S rRNA (uracil1498-N3)-methyltransferase